MSMEHGGMGNVHLGKLWRLQSLLILIQITELLV